MSLEPDVIERIRKDFSPQEFDHALDLMNACGEVGRVARCIMVASRGSLEALKKYIAVAQFDHRDAILAGEYDKFRGCIRDLSVSFLIDAPEKFWIIEVARMMDSRGYILTAIETFPATLGPFEYTSDMNEGRATFAGLKGRIDIEKKNRQWMLHGDPKELDRYNLDRTFQDEREFRDTVSGWLLISHD